MKPALVQCDTCKKAVSPRYAREKVSLWSRTVGAGGTLSNTRMVTRENQWICDPCLDHAEYGTHPQDSLLGGA